MNLVQIRILTNIFKIFKIQKDVIRIILNNEQHFKLKKGVIYTS
jgi:hypothetical protein